MTGADRLTGLTGVKFTKHVIVKLNSQKMFAE
jgi:hypothetical protein